MSLRLLSSPPLRQHSPQFVIARSVLTVRYTLNFASVYLEENQRRSNLLSFINWREILNHVEENHITANQSREIASGTQQQLTWSTFMTPLREPRNGYAMKRSYGGCCKGRESRPLQQICNNSCLTIEGNLYA